MASLNYTDIVTALASSMAVALPALRSFSSIGGLTRNQRLRTDIREDLGIIEELEKRGGSSAHKDLEKWMWEKIRRDVEMLSSEKKPINGWAIFWAVLFGLVPEIAATYYFVDASLWRAVIFGVAAASISIATLKSLTSEESRLLRWWEIIRKHLAFWRK